MLAKNEEVSVPGFLIPTKAFELQTIPKKKPENAMNEDVLKEEEERKEKIAATRRKFKEKHRMILENLMKKNKEIGKKVGEHPLGLGLHS